MQRTIEAAEAFEAFQAFQAAIVEPRLKHSVWHFHVINDARLCDDCEKFAGDFYELADPDDLYGMFEYGEMIDDKSFAPNVHPNCRCIIVKEEDVYYE